MNLLRRAIRKATQGALSTVVACALVDLVSRRGFTSTRDKAWRAQHHPREAYARRVAITDQEQQ